MLLAATTLVLALCPLPQDPSVALQGVVQVERPTAGSRVVQLRQLRALANGRVQWLPILELVGRAADVQGTTDADGAFTVEVAAGAYAVFAFVDCDGDGRWTPAVPEPCAWRARVDVAGGAPPRLELTATAPRHLQRQDRVVAHGALRWRRGYPVVQLHGDATQRGRAHGELLAEQIVDFLRFYVLEDHLGGADAYRQFTAFLDTHFAWPAPMLAELDGVLAGMRASGADLRLPELGRDFAR